jgi:hypothetical protein
VLLGVGVIVIVGVRLGVAVGRVGVTVGVKVIVGVEVIVGVSVAVLVSVAVGMLIWQSQPTWLLGLQSSGGANGWNAHPG